MGLTGWAAEIDALYAGDPSAFVAGRDALAKRVKAAGEKDAAAAIKGLRRPSVGAWYANIAARSSLVSLREWLALGAEIRDAQARLDLRLVGELGTRRAGLEERVVRDLAAHLGALGLTASPAGLEELRGTLRAALADPAASAAVASGRLERSLSYAGFGEVDVSAALAALSADLPVSDGDSPAAGSTVPAAGQAVDTAAGLRPAAQPAGSPSPAAPVGAAPAGSSAQAPDAEATARAARAQAEAARNHARAALTQRESRLAAATRDAAAALVVRTRASDAVEAAERALRAAQERLAATASQLGEASRTLEAAHKAERDALDERGRAEADLRAAERALEEAP